MGKTYGVAKEMTARAYHIRRAHNLPVHCKNPKCKKHLKPGTKYVRTASRTVIYCEECWENMFIEVK